MSLLAVLKVMLGVDSVEYQTKMRDAAAQSALFENSFGQRTTLIERHGLRLVNTAQSVAFGMQRMRVDAMGAIADLAGAAGFGRLAIAAAGVGAVYTVLKGATAAYLADTMTAKSVTSELAEGYGGASVAGQRLAVQIMALQDLAIREGKERRGNVEQLYAYTAAVASVTDAIYKENLAHNATAASATLTAKLAAERAAEEIRLHHESVAALDAAKEAQARFNAEHGKLVPVGAQVQIALARGQQQMKDFADETRRTLGVMNAQDLQAKAELLQRQIVAIARSGGSAAQTVDALGGQIGDVVKVAAELGVQLDPRFQEIAEAVKTGPGLAMDDLFARLRSLPKEVSASREASRAQLEALGEDLKGTVSGGFGRGIQEGIASGTQALQDWTRTTEVVVPVRLDLSEAERQMDALRSGQIPNTGGLNR